MNFLKLKAGQQFKANHINSPTWTIKLVNNDMVYFTDNGKLDRAYFENAYIKGKLNYLGTDQIEDMEAMERD